VLPSAEIATQTGADLSATITIYRTAGGAERHSRSRRRNEPGKPTFAISRPTVVIVCIWLLRIMSALTAPTSMALLAPVEEPSTASQPDVVSTNDDVGGVIQIADRH
jgi:hypothetical protein